MPFGTEQFCVWHIPKTGGTWLMDAMNVAGIEAKQLGTGLHLTKQQYGQSCKHVFHAVLVRDSVDWYSSVWRWMNEYGWSRRPFSAWFSSEPVECFEQFLVRYAGTYKRVIEAYSPTCCVVLRTEELGKDTSCWLRMVGIEFDSCKLIYHPRENVTETPEPHVSHYLAEMIRRTEGVRK
jgi:sulfatase maturation enzyme AslB (radical SAM superfamily)